jgi:hypothetical protein
MTSEQGKLGVERPMPSGHVGGRQNGRAFGVSLGEVLEADHGTSTPTPPPKSPKNPLPGVRPAKDSSAPKNPKRPKNPPEPTHPARILWTLRILRRVQVRSGW